MSTKQHLLETQVSHDLACGRSSGAQQEKLTETPKICKILTLDNRLKTFCEKKKEKKRCLSNAQGHELEEDLSDGESNPDLPRLVRMTSGNHDR